MCEELQKQWDWLRASHSLGVTRNESDCDSPRDANRIESARQIARASGRPFHGLSAEFTGQQDPLIGRGSHALRRLRGDISALPKSDSEFTGESRRIG